jgi:hypothetical protein
MASSSAPRILVYKADGAIPKGSAVKIGSDREHVAIGAANTDGCIGVAQSASSAAEEAIEVAIPGGGGKGLAGETISAGKLLVSHTDGTLYQANASGDRVIAVAMEDAVSGDLFAVEVIVATADAADQ